MLSETWLQSLPLSPIDRIVPLSGGDINDAYAIESGKRHYFLKVHTHVPDNFFVPEAAGLKLIARSARTPHVIDFGEIAADDFLLLEWIPAGHFHNERKLGEDLAHVHRQTSSSFRFDFNNYAGQLPQYNHREQDWTTFYLKWRLAPQIEIAKKRGCWNSRRQENYEKLAERFARTYRELDVVPGLLHGDLWGGNVMYAENGEPVLIDPSVFYGNREMDLAMTRLFGGFGDSFYRAYNAAYPLDPGWEERVPWYQLYYLLCHLNMFGEGYGAAVDRALER
ncbi:fructosamine kinase family protein [Sporolactobacillus sp. CQH2019]|uniref:fructosamine kinase family protein n=1 Tax=Sporolactobacillus sp. CQH2019 TaxID=3023512 RepID=UPI0023680BCB|nr:fructosamine kinase family protein [Sporolactobacillus sp. CQH2019]MDD9148707.1 fructosamine kinase family protein [Sporolactobacillus sp. CQH2019]